MIKSLLAIIFILTAGVLLSQDSRVVWSEEDKFSKEEKGMALFGSDSTHVYILVEVDDKVNDLVLEKRELNSMSLTHTEEIDLPVIEDIEPEFESVIATPDGFIIFSSYYKKEDGTIQVYGVPYSKQGKPLDLPVKIMNFKKAAKGSELVFVSSPNEQNILIAFANDVERRSNASFTIQVVNTALESQWEKRLEIPHKRESLTIEDFTIDDDQRLFLISDISGTKEKGKRYNRYDSKTRYVMMIYDSALNTLKEFDVGLPGKWVTSASFGFTPLGNLAVVGFYTKEMDFSLAGTFYFVVNPNSKTVVTSGSMAFEPSFISQFDNPGGSMELHDFYFDKIYFLKDGSAILLAEQYYETERVITDPSTGRQSVSTIYNFNDIIAVKVNTKGAMEWTKKISKKQSTVDDHGKYSSYVSACNGEKIFLVFNDHEDNSIDFQEGNLDKPKSYSSARRASLVLVEMNDTGDFTRENLFMNKDEEIIMVPRFNKAMQDWLVFYGEYKKTFKLGALKLN